jgi:TPR repeat protein
MEPNMTTTSSLLPPLYLHDKVICIGRSFPEEHNSVSLPWELLQRCLTDYADWGDLAKLACVQSSWRGLMYDAADSSVSAKWQLAQALEFGSNGLEASPNQAMKLYLELSNANIVTLDGQESDTVSTVKVGQVDPAKPCFAPAMKRLASYYLTDNGAETPIESNIGLAWLQASHELGNDADAAHEVALMYEYGTHGIQIDVVEAALWFEKAAQSGHMEAMAELGLCYELGCGVDQSDQKALDWYIAAAEKGHLTAKYSVGEAYEEARGVPQSDEEACLWYYKAAIEGDEDSRKALRRLEDVARIVLPNVGVLLDG